ncbi:MAG: cell division protein FtsZ [Alphaproteobacteria bacterium]|nr:MAG: cell division protein FtsZ [Alphaproteobacteria bacterium]
MSINLRVPKAESELKPRITVVGAGGAGGNAVNNMIRSNLQGVEFICANTDAQALQQSLAERKIQLGVNINRGLGAGAKPEVGKAAAEESIEEIMQHIEGSNMCFITAGMGGGTGSGAGPVIARASRELGILTVGVVTKPFTFEGAHRMKLAENAIEEMQQYVDTLIVIPNQNLFRIANERTTFADAFKMADDVLYSGVRGVTDLITMPGLINLDFADIQTVMAEMGKAMMGTGEAEGDRRALDAAEAAINNPLLDDVSMKGARAVLINITGGLDMTLFEVDEAANRIRSEVDPDANIIFGAFFDEKLVGRMRISIVAAGMDALAIRANNDARQNPFGPGLRPQKVVPHADIIANARKTPAPIPSAPVSTPPSASAYTANRTNLNELSSTSYTPRNTAPAPRAEVKSPVSTTSNIATNNFTGDLPDSDLFIPPKPSVAETSKEDISLTERIVPSAIETQDEPQTVRVDLKQDRPLEKAMHRPATMPSETTPGSGTQTPYSRTGTAGSFATERSPESQASKSAERAQRRGPGLFERMMGGVLGGAANAAPSTPPARQEPTLLKTEAPTAKETSEPVQESLTPKAENDDLLDIPAFLRRGNN